MKNTGKIIDEGVAIFECGKIAYGNSNRRINMTQVDFGFRKLRGNKEAYLTITVAFGIANILITSLVVLPFRKGFKSMFTTTFLPK